MKIDPTAAAATARTEGAVVGRLPTAPGSTMQAPPGLARIPPMSAERTGLLLINLGTPDGPGPGEVRPYLREFLSDPRVIDIAAWKRRLILELFILPFRPRRSAEAYRQIWDERGSPLLYHTRDLAAKVQRRLGEAVLVEAGMRYGNPSIASALERFRAAGIDRVVAFPMFPQYSSAATGSAVEKVWSEAGKLWNTPYVQIVPPFYDDPGFIECFARVAGPHIEEIDPHVVFFSFHGVPERHVVKSDDTGEHCLKRDDCCGSLVSANRNCYRAQCFVTARLLAERLGIPREKREISFQSRLGRDPWIKPYTDVQFDHYTSRGAKRAVVLSPAFVADCLETLEELGLRGVEQWQQGGGEQMRVVPCPNADDAWADAVVDIARRHSAWLRVPEKATQTGRP